MGERVILGTQKKQLNKLRTLGMRLLQMFVHGASQIILMELLSRRRFRLLGKSLLTRSDLSMSLLSENSFGS